MSWNQSVVTNAGVGLLNESLAGHTLTIESAVGGAGTLTEEELAAATDVADQKQTFALLGIEDIEGGKRVGIQITNNGVSESYILHQIGVQARLEYEEAPLTLLIILQDEHGVEIPTEAENPDWLFEIYAVISISNKANITVNIDTSAIASVSYVQRTFVPMTRKINGKVLSGDVTLSGDDIKTSAEDDTSVSAALSNKADITPPQEFLLPLPEGWNGTIRYSKTQDSMVTIYVDIIKETAIGVGTFAVGQLPAGYYPRYLASCACVNVVPGAVAPTASRLIVEASGELLVQQPDTAAIGFVGSITFIAKESEGEQDGL